VAISSPTTAGKDETAVAGTALPFNVSGPELVTLPTGPLAIRTTVVIITISRHKYLTATSFECKPPWRISDQLALQRKPTLLIVDC
jgi:hypothetical protein